MLQSNPMQNPNHTPPSIGATAFNCPHHECGAFAHQSWRCLEPRTITPKVTAENRAELMARLSADPAIVLPTDRSAYVREGHVQGLFVSQCSRCNEIAIWVKGRIAWPSHGDAPRPNPDLPPSVLEDYEEAGAIASVSPRGAAALLRLAVEKLCRELVPDKNNLNDRIAELFKRGLNQDIQRALDSVRVVGNHAVHPGQIDFKDDPAKVTTLFGLINFVAQVMITNPKELAEIYESLPEDDRKNIKKRDGQKAKS